jgi:hypothetical protein
LIVGPIAAEIARPLSRRGAALCLVGIAGLSIAVRILLARDIPAPFIFMDELGYEQMAKSIAEHGTVAIYGKVGLSYSPLYPVVLAPIYMLTSSATLAFAMVKVVNAVLMTLAVVPLYGIARSVLGRAPSVGVAALSLAAPLMFYTQLEMSESLAYPLFLVAIWAMLRGIRHPSWGNDLLLLATILLAAAARLQQIVLVPAAVTAIAAVALLAPGGPRWGAVVRSLRRHWVLVGLSVLGLAVLVVRRAANGGALPLAGRYANVGTAHASPLRVLVLLVQHLAGLDLAVGVAPFAAALVAAYALRSAGFPPERLVFGAVATAATVWLLLLVAWDAAAFDAAGTVTQGAANTPRIHERYLFYLVPLFLVALVAVLRSGRRIPRSRYFAAAGAAALLPAAIPFSRVINSTIVADSFSLQFFARNGHFAPIGHAKLAAVGLASVLAASFVLAAWGRAWPAVVMTVVAFVFMSHLERDRIHSAAVGAIHGGLPSHPDWVDRTVDGENVILVGGNGAGLQRIGLWETAFFNLKIGRIYYTCPSFFGSEFGERPAAVDPVTGSLEDTTGSGTLVARYAVVPSSLGLVGQVLAEDESAGLMLVAPADGILTVPAASRAAARCKG